MKKIITLVMAVGMTLSAAPVHKAHKGCPVVSGVKHVAKKVGHAVKKVF
jgi:hypothetical protein